MSIIGSNPNTQGPAPPPREISEHQQTASHNLGLVLARLSDSMATSAAMERTITTHEEARGGHFSSDASRPSLPVTRHLRTGGLPQDFDKMEWKNSYEQLKELLPEDAKERYAHEMSKPFDQRSFYYASLDNLLQLAAQFGDKVDKLEVAPAPGSASSERLIINQAQPYIAAQASLQTGRQLLDELSSLLGTLGANHPQYGPISQELPLLQELLEPLEAQLRLLFEKKGEAPPELSQSMQQLNEQLGSQIASLQGRTAIHGTASLLLAQLQAIHATLGALCQATQNSPSPLVALSIAAFALTGRLEEGAILTPSLSSAIEGLLRFTSPQDSSSSQSASQSRLDGASMLLIAAFVAGSLIEDKGIGATPEKEPLARNMAHFCDLQLLLHATLASSLPQELIAASSSSNLTADGLLLSSLFAIGIAFTKGHSEQLASLLDGLSSFVGPPIERLSQQAEERLQQGAIDKQERQQLIQIRVAHKAQQEGSSQLLVDTFSRLAQEATGGPKEWDASVALLRELATTLLSGADQVAAQRSELWHGGESVAI